MSEKWKPEKGETYWFFGFEGDVHPRTYYGDSFDSQLMVFGNMFKIAKEAEAAVEKIKDLLLSLQEPVTDCNQLPKLTAEVFDRFYCPAWAKYAAVDKSGEVWVFEKKPIINVSGELWALNCICNCRTLMFKADNSDWQNSLIERPKNKQAGSDFVEKIIKSGLIEKARSEVAKKSYENLRNVKYRGLGEDYQREQYIDFLKNKKSELAVFPEWCKVWEWVYSPCCCNPDKGTYFKVTQIDDVCIIGEDYVCHVDNAVRARLRPYNTEEMQALVGKIICWDSREKIYIVECCADFHGEISVYFGGHEHSAKDLIVGKYILSDGKPCGVLEHLNENGDWVE